MRDLVLNAFRSALPATVALTAIYAGDEVLFERDGIDDLPWGGPDFPVIGVMMPTNSGEVPVWVWIYTGDTPEEDREDVVAAVEVAVKAAQEAFVGAGGVLVARTPDPVPEEAQEAP